MAARKREAKRRNWPANLNQNGAGYFYYRDPDTKKDYGLGRDQARAFQEARAANAEVAKRRGHVSLAQRITAPDGKTLTEWSVTYEELYLKDRKPTDSTMKTVKSGIRAACSAPFAGKHLRTIKTDEVAAFLDEAVTKRGATMAKLVRKTLHDMFRTAETKGLIDTGMNPVTVTKNAVIEVERSRLTLEHFRAIYAKAKDLDPWVARSMEIAMLTAQRREDISNMQFSDVQDGFLFVTQSKTGAKIRIPTAVRLEALNLSLEEVIKQCRDDVLSKWVLHHRRKIGARLPGSQVGPDALTKAFAKVRGKAELTWDSGKTPPTFHELRSLAARLYAEQHGADFAQAILGHKTASMTEMYRDVRGAEWVEVKL